MASLRRGCWAWDPPEAPPPPLVVGLGKPLVLPVKTGTITRGQGFTRFK